MDKIGGAFTDPMGYLGDILDENEMLALMQDPEQFERFMAQRMVQSSYQRVPMVPTGGFMNQMPNYMNTDQLILSGLY